MFDVAQPAQPDVAALFAAFDAADAEVVRLREDPDHEDDDMTAWCDALYATGDIVEALPNTPENLDIRARAVGSLVCSTSNPMDIDLGELSRHVHGLWPDHPANVCLRARKQASRSSGGIVMLNGFFEPMRSRIEAIPLQEIQSIGGVLKRGEHDTYHLMQLRGDRQTVEMYENEVRSLMSRPAQLLPAQSGSMLLYVSADREGAFVTRTPLIAWALCLDGLIRPVTPSGVDDGDMHPPYGWFVEIGGVITPCSDTGYENEFADEDALLAAVNRWWLNEHPAPTEGEVA
jgi:hypothetical protein